MGKKRRILLAALLVALLCAFGWWLMHPSEPSYKGKTLSVWLQDYSMMFSLHYESSPDVNDAVRHIGTNGIPTLLRMLRANESPLKTKCIELLDGQPLVRIRLIPAWEKIEEASLAFDALGADASNAVPGLIEIYDEKISDLSQAAAAGSLGEIGPAAKPAIPSLLRGLSTTNELVRRDTVYAFGKIHSDSELVVPELMKLLHDSDSTVRAFAVRALGEFGTNAKVAIPNLHIMLNDPSTGNAATNALKQIDPAAAAKAGVK